MYSFEYTVDRGKGLPMLRAISVIAVPSRGILLTLTVVARESEWDTGDGEKLRRVADSFHLV